MINFLNEFSKMELKDVFYTLGILSTFLIGFLNYFTTLKNRKNVLREHVYKEQFNILGKLNFELQKLNCTLIKSLKVNVDNSILEDNIDNIENILYSNTHILSTKFSNNLKELIKLLELFIENNNGKNPELLAECYDDFNEKYYALIKLIVIELGVSELYNENRNLLKS